MRCAGTRLVLLAASLALASCSGSAMNEWVSGKPKPVEPNIFPADYKNEILTTVQRTQDDPSNIRGAMITDPQLQRIGTEDRYVVCVRYNARDINKQYAGPKDRVVYFYGGHINQFVDATPEQCGRAAYKPFPELEKICLSSKC